jgi:hypothetical protein
MSYDDITLVEGETAELPLTVKADDEEFAIEYTAENDKVTVDGGTLTAVSAGKCKIIAKAGSSEKAFTVTVLERGILSVQNITLAAGETAKIKAIISSKDIKCEIKFTFEGSDIEISDNIVKGITPGSVTVVTATTPYHTAKFNVTVEEDYGTMSVTGPESIYSNYPGKPVSVEFSNPEYATSVTYTSNVSGVRVENGLVYASGIFDEPVQRLSQRRFPRRMLRFRPCQNGTR